MNIAALIDKYGIISDQVTRPELETILKICQEKTATNGAFVEFGCYAGTTSLFIERLIEASGRQCTFHVYDSFVGLPEKGSVDWSPLGEQFQAGELASSKKAFIEQFKKAGLQLPIIHKAWFSELADDEVPSNISFAFLDGDYYDSIKTSLELIEDKLAPNASIVVDDYGNMALPGAKKAVDEWAKKHQQSIQVVHSLAVIRLK